MRILHITPAYTPAFQFGGPIQSIHAMNRALVRKGVEVYTMTTTAGLEDKNDLTHGWVNVDGVMVRYFRYYGYLHFTFSPFMFADLASRVRGFDLLHLSAVWNFPPLAGSLIAGICGKPYLMSPRGAMNPEAMTQRSRMKKRLYYRIFAERCLRMAAMLHFTTEDEQDRTLGSVSLRNRSVVIPNGIDLDLYERLPEPGAFSARHAELVGRPYVLFLGRISPIKGLDVLVRAFGRLKQVKEDLMLVLAGPDSEGYGTKVRDWLRRDGLLERTIFTGMISGSEKLAALRDAALFVLPSYSENFGMAVVEAMACGTPVVISDGVGIHREVAANRAGIVVKTDETSLLSGMKDLLGNDRLRREIGENGRKMVHSYYNIDRIADMMIKVYEDILSSPQGKQK